MANTIEIVKAYMKAKKITQAEIARQLGEKVQVLNQQLNRQQDLKADRFIELMECMGYRIEILDNHGIRRIEKGTVDAIRNGLICGSKFFTVRDDGKVLGIWSHQTDFAVKEFENRKDCFDWLNFREKQMLDTENLLRTMP